MTFKFYLRMVATAMTILLMASGCKDSDTDDNTPLPTETPTYTFEVSVYDTSDVATFVKTKPSDELATYVCGVVTKDLFDTFASDQSFLVNDVEKMKAEAEEYNLTINNYLEKKVAVGEIPSRFTGLDPNTEYYAYAYGITLNGEVTSILAKKAFATEKARQKLTFEISVSGVDVYGATVAVTPSNNSGTYYYDVFEKAEMDKFADDAAIIAELEKSADFEKGLVTGPASYTYGPDTKALKPKTEYYAYAFEYGNTSVAAPEITKVTFTTKSDEPFVPSYASWLGKWRVTSTSSLTGGNPVTFDIEINQKVGGSTYTVKNWGITPWSSQIVFEAQYHSEADEYHQKGAISFANGLSFGNLDSSSPEYDITLLGYYDNGGKPMVVTGEYSCATGMLSSETEATMSLYEVELKSGKKTMIGAEIFGLDVPNSQFGTYTPMEDYKAGGYPVGPYTLIKTGDVTLPKNLTFVIDVTTTETTASAQITPSNNTDSYYFDLVPASWYGNADAAIVAALNNSYAQYGGIIEMVSVGPDNYDWTGLTAGTKYYIIAFGYDESGATTAITWKEVTTAGGGGENPGDLTFVISVTGITSTAAKITVTPSNNTDSYYFDVLSKSTMDKFSDADIIAAMNDDGKLINYVSVGEDYYNWTNGTPGTEYYAFAFGFDSTGATTSITKQVFTTTAGTATPEYNAWLGTWTVTSASSEINKAPVSFDVSFTAKSPGVSYTLAGWSISSVRTSAAYVAEATFDSATDGFSIMNDQVLGTTSQGTVMISGRAYLAEDSKTYIINGATTAIIGTMGAGGNSASAVGGPVRVSGYAETIFTSIDFCLDFADGSGSGYWPADEGYTKGDFPVGPYTMVKKSNQAAPVVPASRSMSFSSILKPVTFGTSVAANSNAAITRKNVAANVAPKSRKNLLVKVNNVGGLANTMMTVGKAARYTSAVGVIASRDEMLPMSLSPMKNAEPAFRLGTVRK